VIIEGVKYPGRGAMSCVDVEAAQRSVQLVAKIVGADVSVIVEFDVNHAEALETAIRAARLEVQARAVSP
jgi:hypothetical protein